MAAVVVDANVLIAAQLSRDQHHETAARMANGIEEGTLPVGLVPEDVLAEVLNFLQNRSSHATAIEMLDGVLRSDGLEVTPHTDSDFDAAHTVFRRFDGLSFTDAIIAAFVRRTGRRYVYSFDDDFDAVEGVVRLDAAIDPYR